MIDYLKTKLSSLLKRDKMTSFNGESESLSSKSEKTFSNDDLGKKQNMRLIKILSLILASIVILIGLLTNKQQKKIEAAEAPIKLETAEKALDTDKMWRNHFEEKISDTREVLEQKLKEAAEQAVIKETQLLEGFKREMEVLKEQLAFAKEELQGASIELTKANEIQNALNAKAPPLEISNTTSNLLGNDTEYDEPKNSRYYIPETSYVTGYLLGGLAVSTAMSAPDSNTTPVVIRLTDRGNLPKNFSVDIASCKILGSSYGDLSSERAIVRLEKMICIDPKTELITTTSVAGTVYGDDGANGLKGTVISMGSKHLQNAMIGGVISGLSQSAKGQEGYSVTSLGAISTNKQTITDMLQKGAFAGASNAAEKVAEYYLKLAESISPILSIPPGARVQAMFLKGFHIGEIKTHAKIAKARAENKRQSGVVQEQNIVSPQMQGTYNDE